MKHHSMKPGFHLVFSLSAALTVLTGCGGGGNAMSQMGPGPISQNAYPLPGEVPSGPILVPTGTQCASAMPSLSGTPAPLSAMVDGEEGCIRLISVEQYQDTAASGALINSIVGETEIDYHYVSRSTRPQRRRGVEVTLLAASAYSRTTCSDVRSSPFGNPGTSVDLPLWIKRSTGAIGQTIRVTAGSANLHAVASANISTARQGTNLNSFIQTLSSQGFQSVQAAQLPNGDYEVFLSRTRTVPGTAAAVRSVTRAVYSLDY